MCINNLVLNKNVTILLLKYNNHGLNMFIYMDNEIGSSLSVGMNVNKLIMSNKTNLVVIDTSFNKFQSF